MIELLTWTAAAVLVISAAAFVAVRLIPHT